MDSAFSDRQVGAMALWAGDPGSAPLSRGELRGGPATADAGGLDGLQQFAGRGFNLDFGSPEAQDGTADDYAVDEDSVLTVPAVDGVLANDSADPGSTAVVDTDVAHGVLVLNADGSFT